tara:strand:- start:759 stop:1118 length:360 start_codon:yes stop_codon:yes gene_type:complete
MTITFNNTDLTYNFFINGDFPLANGLKFMSMHSNTPLFDVDATVLIANTRYSQLEFTLSELIGLKHVEGIYRYIVFEDGVSVQEGVVKVFTTPGGTTGTEPYISNNEDREATVFYRPQY